MNREIAARDRVLSHHERTSADLLVEARQVAEDLNRINGKVTAGQVLEVLRNKLGGAVYSRDPRFVGAVFRSGWTRVGYVPEGSHGRPVAVWKK